MISVNKQSIPYTYTYYFSMITLIILMEWHRFRRFRWRL